MYLRGHTYGRISGIGCPPIIIQHSITSRPPSAPEPRQSHTRRIRSAYQWISYRHSHTAAAEEEDKKQQDTEPSRAIRLVQSNNPYPTPSHRFINLDQAQHDFGAESWETLERERYSDLIAKFLPIEPLSQQKDKRLRRATCGIKKEDTLFVSRLLKDKGQGSNQWRIALSDLSKHYRPESSVRPKEPDSYDHATSLVQNAGSHSQDSEIQSPARRVTFSPRVYKSFRLVHSISPPTEWSEANLAVYVEALAESQRIQARVPWAGKLQADGWTNIEDIFAAFDTVFYSMALQKFLSVKACNIALRFFYDHGTMTKARSLYIRMEDLKMHIPTDTYNILLRGSASQRDLYSFTYLLNNMTRRGFKPNEETWTLFLQAIESSTVRAVIVRKMAEMNMLDKPGIRRAVAAHMVDYEIANHLDDGHDHHSFLDHMNSKYGIGWLSTSAGNRILNEVAKRKSAAESLGLLYKMKQAGFIPDDISMNTLLRHCLPLRRHELAIEIVDVFSYHYRLYPGPEAHETLFRQAWESRLLNFSTVIWRSACIYSAVTKYIRRLVLRSLSSTPAPDKRIQSDDTAESSTSSRNEKFRKFAGSFVIGVEGFRAELNQAMGTLGLDPRRRTVEWAKALVESGVRVARTRRFKKDLPLLLRQALIRDKAWAVKGLYKKDDWCHHRGCESQKKAPTQTSTAPAETSGSRTVCHSRVHSNKALNRRISPKITQSGADQQTVVTIRKSRASAKAARLCKARQRTRPIRFAFPSALLTVRRTVSARQSPRSRSRLRSIPRSRGRRRECLIRRLPTVVSRSSVRVISRPLLLDRNRAKEQPKSVPPPQTKDPAPVLSGDSSKVRRIRYGYF